MYGIPKRKHAANGGLIVGPGTGTSDSIKKEVPEGTYILPADTTAKLGYGMPGYNGRPKAAQKEQPKLGWPGYRKQMSVNLSNGEYELPPEQVHAVGVQALDQMKDATHTQVPGRGFMSKQQKERMASKEKPELFFANGGLVDDERKLKQNSFDMTNTPAVQPRAGLSPQGIQGMARDAASKPATGYGAPRGGKLQDAASQPGFGWKRAADVPAGIGQAVAGALSTPVAAGKDALRNVAAYATGADPARLPGGATRYRDEAVGQFQSGLDRVGEVVSGLQQAGQRALGIQPLPEGAATPAVSSVSTAAEGPAAQGGTGLGWRKTGIGADRQGGEIAGRVGANGVPEFTNEAATPGAVSEGLGFGPTSRMAQDKAGSMASIGDGVGTFSQGEEGDAKMALERFERANQIRGEAIANRPRDLGDAGGRVTVVRDSSRSPTLADIQNARLDARQGQTDALRQQTEQAGALNTQRMSTEKLQQQRLQQELATGQYGLKDRQRLAGLQAQIANPATSPEARAAAQQAYAALTSTPTERAAGARNAATQEQKQQRVRADLFKTYSELRPVTDDGKPIPFDQWAQPALQGAQPSSPPGLPAGVNRDQVLAEARAAVASGWSRERVNQRLQEWGLPPLQN